MNLPPPAVAHERVGAPICPECGATAMFTRPFWPIDGCFDWFQAEVNRWYAVACWCGWKGMAQKVRSVAGPANRAGR
jgi:hypothetical protein